MVFLCFIELTLSSGAFLGHLWPKHLCALRYNAIVTSWKHLSEYVCEHALLVGTKTSSGQLYTHMMTCMYMCILAGSAAACQNFQASLSRGSAYTHFHGFTGFTAASEVVGAWTHAGYLMPIIKNLFCCNVLAKGLKRLLALFCHWAS